MTFTYSPTNMTQVSSPVAPVSKDVGLADLFILLVRRKWIILGVTVLAALIAAALAFTLQPKYDATVTVIPVTEDPASSRLSGLGSIISQYGAIASLGGLSIGGDNKKIESMAVLQSDSLTKAYIQANNLLPVLHARSTDNEELSLWEANRYFKKEIRKVTEDKKTGLTSITIVWSDPLLAAKWANDLVKMTNDFLRDRAIKESEKNIEYLKQQAEKTDLIQVKLAMNSLLEGEIKRSMLARGSEEYALKVIDPAVPPERPFFPQPALWILGAAVGGFLLSYGALFFWTFLILPSNRHQAT